MFEDKLYFEETTMAIKLLNWNVEWAKRGSSRGAMVSNIIQDHHPNVACITESFSDLFDEGHTICSQPDYATLSNRAVEK
jgi:hypothetical protein